MKRIAYLLIATLVVTFALMGCSKDESTTTAPPPSNNEEEQAPAFSAQPLDVPDSLANETDPHAQMAVGYINMANAFVNYMNFVTPPSKTSFEGVGTLSGPPWIYTWPVNIGPDNNYMVTLTIDEDNDYYTWTVELDGVFDGYSVTNFTLIEASQAKDGTSGELTVYDPESLGIALSVSWVLQNGTYTVTYLMPEEVRIVVTLNPDESGSVEAYEWNGSAFVKVFEAQWTATGAGEWWTWNIDGTPSGHGTWS